MSTSDSRRGRCRSRSRRLQTSDRLCVPRSAGRDVTDLGRTGTAATSRSVERGRYQGIAKEHYGRVRAEPNQARGLLAGREEGRLVLVAQGWVYPTDSSINVAVGQGRHERPRGVSLEVQGAKADGRSQSRFGLSRGKEQDDADRPERGRQVPAAYGCGRTWRSTGIRWPRR